MQKEVFLLEPLIHEWIHHIFFLIPIFITYFFIIEYLTLHQMKLIKIQSHFLSILMISIIASIPQCSITIMMVFLFSQRKITFGGLVASFIACNDESVLLLLGGSYQQQIISFIFLKMVLAIISGLIIDLFPFSNNSISHNNSIHHHKNIFQGVFIHTFQLITLLTLSMFISEILLHYLPFKELLSFIPQSFLFTILGFIPGCGMSFLAISLLNKQIISFFTYCCLLTTCNGYGLVVLFKNHYKSYLLLIMILVLCVNAFILSFLCEVIL